MTPPQPGASPHHSVGSPHPIQSPHTHSRSATPQTSPRGPQTPVGTPQGQTPTSIGQAPFPPTSNGVGTLGTPSSQMKGQSQGIPGAAGQTGPGQQGMTQMCLPPNSAAAAVATSMGQAAAGQGAPVGPQGGPGQAVPVSTLIAAQGPTSVGQPAMGQAATSMALGQALPGQPAAGQMAPGQMPGQVPTPMVPGQLNPGQMLPGQPTSMPPGQMPTSVPGQQQGAPSMGPGGSIIHICIPDAWPGARSAFLQPPDAPRAAAYDVSWPRHAHAAMRPGFPSQGMTHMQQQHMGAQHMGVQPQQRIHLGSNPPSTISALLNQQRMANQGMRMPMQNMPQMPPHHQQVHMRQMMHPMQQQQQQQQQQQPPQQQQQHQM